MHSLFMQHFVERMCSFFSFQQLYGLCKMKWLDGKKVATLVNCRKPEDLWEQEFSNVLKHLVRAAPLFLIMTEILTDAHTHTSSKDAFAAFVLPGIIHQRVAAVGDGGRLRWPVQKCGYACSEERGRVGVHVLCVVVSSAVTVFLIWDNGVQRDGQLASKGLWPVWLPSFWTSFF